MTTSQKQAMIRHTTQYAAANYLSQFLGIANSILLRRFLGPTAMGVWSILQVILGYCGNASLGTTKALARDYPYYRGKGEFEKADQLKNVTTVFSMAMSIIPTILILGYLAVKWQDLEPTFRIGLIFMAIFLFVQRFYDILLTVLRSEKKFALLSLLVILNAAGGLLVTVTLVKLFNLYGLLAGTALLTFLAMGVIHKFNPIPFKIEWNRPLLMGQMKLGIPLVAFSFLYEFLRSLDKLVIAGQLGFHDVGLYSIAMMVNAYVASLPMMFAHVWYPNLQEKYGAVNRDIHGIKDFLKKPIFIVSVVVPCISAMAIFLVPPLAEVFLPKFLSGLPAMKVYLVGTYFLMIGQFSNNFLVTIDKYLITIPILLAACAVNYLLNTLLIEQGWGLVGVGLGSTISFAVYGLISYGLCVKQFTDKKEIVLHFLKVLVLPIYLFGAAWLLDGMISFQSIWVEALAKCILFVLVALPTLWALERQYQLFSKIAESLISRRSSQSKNE